MFQFSRCSKNIATGTNDAAAPNHSATTVATTAEATMTASAGYNVAKPKPATNLKPIEEYVLSSDSEDERKYSELRRKAKEAEKEKLRQTLQNAKLNLSSPKNDRGSPYTPLKLETVVQECLAEIPDHTKVTVRQVMRKIAHQMKLPKLPPETKEAARLLLVKMLKEQALSKKAPTVRSTLRTSWKQSVIDRVDQTSPSVATRDAIEKRADPTAAKITTDTIQDLKSVVQACLNEVPDPSQITVGQVMRKIADRLQLRKLPTDTKAAAKRHVIEILQAQTSSQPTPAELSSAQQKSKDNDQTPPKTATCVQAQDQESSGGLNIAPYSSETPAVECLPPPAQSTSDDADTNPQCLTTVEGSSTGEIPAATSTVGDKPQENSIMPASNEEMNVRKRGKSEIDSEDQTEKPSKAKKSRAKTKAAPTVASADTAQDVKAPTIPKQRKQTTKRPSQKHIVAEATKEVTNESTPQNKRKASSKRCRWCNQCSCQTTKVPKTLGTNSSVAIEKALIKRLVQLESTADHYDAQTDAVRRQLQRHRRNLYQRRTKLLTKQTNQRDQQKIFILPDVDALEQKYNTMTSKPRKAPQNAKERLFASSAAPQRTLTQLVGGETVEEETELGEDSELEPALPIETINSEEGDTGETLIDFSLEDEAALSSAPANVERRDRKHPESAWNAGQTGCFQTEWDELFLQHLGNNNAEDAMDQLVGLFGTPETPRKQSKGSRKRSPVMLSARGKRLTNEIINEVDENEALKQAVEKGCTDWKENIQFAMAQRETQDLQGALINVRSAKERLAKQRTKIMEFLDQRSSTLELFENSLERSLGRLISEGIPSTPNITKMC